MPGRRNLKVQRLCLRDERKICYIYERKKQIPVKLTGGGLASVENLGLFFQSSGNVKQSIITRNRTYNLPHKFPNNLGLMALGNEELLMLLN